MFDFCTDLLLNADCFENNSWVEIPEQGLKHTREKSSYSVTQEIPAYFTASSKLKETQTIQIKTTNLATTAPFKPHLNF